jgi:hypothetical protein
LPAAQGRHIERQKARWAIWLSTLGQLACRTSSFAQGSGRWRIPGPNRCAPKLRRTGATCQSAPPESTRAPLGREGDRSDPPECGTCATISSFSWPSAARVMSANNTKGNHGQHSKKNPEVQTLWEIALESPNRITHLVARASLDFHKMISRGS